MTDHADLVERLRRDGIAARDTLKCVEMAPTVDPEDALKAADTIEALEKRILEIERIAQKQADKLNELGGSIAAYQVGVHEARIAELEAALKDAMEELRHAYIMGFTERYRDAARAALKALGEKECY